MVVIGLYGAGSKGKSQTLRSVIQGLVDAGASCSDPRAVQAGGDVKCCLTTMEGKKICITTAGDTGDIQKENLVFVAQFGAIDAWITATKTRGFSVDEIWNSALNVNEVFWVPKTVCDHIYKQEKGKWDNSIQVEEDEALKKDQEDCNMFDAKRIGRLLKRLI